MLKGVPPILSPELLKVLAEMGHSDRIVIGDGNFPGETMGKNAKVIRCDGMNIPELLDAILTMIPLDTYVEHPVLQMELVPNDVGKIETPIWDEYIKIISKYDDRGAKAIKHIERFAFYEETKKCYAVLTTSDRAVYANIILQKGVVEL